MSDAHFFKGTSTDQDNRFADKKKKLAKTMKFPDNLDKKVDMTNIKLDTIKPWITKKITQLLAIEDDVVIEFVFNQLEPRYPDGKEMQMNLTGFLNAKNARNFMEQLWDLLLSAMDNDTGIPATFLEQKKEEIMKRQMEQGKLKELERKVDRSRSKSNGRYKRSPLRDRSRQDKYSLDKKENTRFDQRNQNDEPEGMLQTSVSDIKLPGESNFDTNANDGGKPDKSNNETNVQSSSELQNMAKASSERDSDKTKLSKRKSSTSSTGARRSRSISLRRRKRSISRRRKSPSPRSRRARRSPRSRSRRRSPRRRTRSPLRRRSSRRRSRTPRRSRSPAIRPHLGRRTRTPIRRSKSPVRRSRSPLQKIKRSTVRPRDSSKSSASSERSHPLIRKRVSSSTSEADHSPIPVRKEPSDTMKRVYRKRSPSKSSGSPSPQRLPKMRVPQRKRYSSSAERMPLERDYKQQRLEENIRREESRRYRYHSPQDRKDMQRRREPRNVSPERSARHRDRSFSSGDEKMLRRRLEEDKIRKNMQKRRRAPSGNDSSKERTMKTVTRVPHPLKTTHRVRKESPDRDVKRHREVSSGSGSREPSSKRKVVEEHRRIITSKKEAMSSEDENKKVTQKSDSRYRQQLDENIGKKYLSHDADSALRKTSRNSRSPVTRKVAVVPPLKSKDVADSDDQEMQSASINVRQRHEDDHNAITQRPLNKHDSDNEGAIPTGRVRKHSSSPDATPEPKQKLKRRKEDDESGDSDEENARKRKKHAKKHKKHKKHKKKHHRNKSDDDVEEDNELEIEDRKKSGNLDKLEQELREKALRSLKEAKQTHSKK